MLTSLDQSVQTLKWIIIAIFLSSKYIITLYLLVCSGCLPHVRYPEHCNAMENRNDLCLSLCGTNMTCVYVCMYMYNMWWYQWYVNKYFWIIENDFTYHVLRLMRSETLLQAVQCTKYGSMLRCVCFIRQYF